MNSKRLIRKYLLILGIIIAVVICGVFAHQLIQKPALISVNSSTTFQVLSNEFANNGTIPDRNTCAANNLSPQLTFLNVPKPAKSLALVMHDLDAPGGDFTHWLVWNIPSTTKDFNEASVAPGANMGTTDFGTASYGGPCPNSGTHRYVIDVYALDTKLALPMTARRMDFDSAIKGHTIGHTSLNAIVTAQK